MTGDDGEQSKLIHENNGRQARLGPKKKAGEGKNELSRRLKQIPTIQIRYL